MSKLRCSACERILEPTQFYTNPCKPRGYSQYCKVCERDYGKCRTNTYHKKYKQMHENGELTMLSEQRCSRCKEIKPADKFSKSSYTKSGLQAYCKKCRKEYVYLKRLREKV